MFGLSAVISATINAAIGIISNTVSVIGRTLATYAPKLLQVAGKWLPVVADVVSGLANILNVTDEKENPEELGYKALNSDKKLEDFDSTKEYIEYIKNSIEVDEEKMKNATDEEKLAYMSIGSSVLIKGIEENKDIDEINAKFFVSIAKLGVDKIGGVDTVNSILDTFKDGKLEDFAKYVSGDLESAKERILISNRLVEMYKTLNPDMDIKDVQKIVTDMSNVE